MKSNLSRTLLRTTSLGLVRAGSLRPSGGGGGGAPATDPLFANVVLLIQPTSADSSVVDRSLLAHAIAANGNAAISNALGLPDGRRSIVFDGNDSLSLSDNDAWHKPGDLCIEFRARFTEDVMMYLTGQWNGNSDHWTLKYEAGGAIRLENFSGGQSLNIVTSNGVVPLNTEVHVALTKSGTSWTIWVDGVSRATATSSATISNVPAFLLVGAFNHPSLTNNMMRGHLLGWRETKGSPRYTGPFTPPTTFPTS